RSAGEGLGDMVAFSPSPALRERVPSVARRVRAQMANSMKQKLAAGELVLCMNLRLARTVDIAMVAKAGGYDALYVDMEHSPYSIDTAATICAAAIGMALPRWCACRATMGTGRAGCLTAA